MADTNPQAAAVGAESDSVDAEELIALIKAIKFAYDDYGCKRVHEQIKTHGGKYERVPLKRVKKYMQKLRLTNVQEPAPDAKPSTEETRGKSESEQLKEQAKKASGKPGVVQLMTVGGKTKSERPAAATSNATSEADATDKWLPVKLDEPAVKASKFPYQAVIRMTNTDEGDATGALGEIYKIQVAMGPDGALSSAQPMLVYNKARNRKTFLHPDSPAYRPVLGLIKAQGASGVVGGAKAYFWGRFRQQDDMLYINTDQLAPAQQW